MYQVGQDDPFGNLWAMNTRSSRNGDIRLLEDGRVGDLIRAGREELDELEVGCVGDFGRQ